MTISGIMILLYGGMLYGIFPDFVESNVSWEAHLLGGIAGVLMAFLFRKTKIDIEEEPEVEDDDDDEESYFSSATWNDSIDVNYSYKPKNANSSK